MWRSNKGLQKKHLRKAYIPRDKDILSFKKEASWVANYGDNEAVY